MKNLPKIVVATKSYKMNTLELISAAQSVKTTGDPDAGSPPVNDATLQAQANTLQTIHNGRNVSPPTATAAQEKKQKNLLVRSYNKNARYIEGMANDVAAAAGDVNAGIEVVNRTGLKLKKVKLSTSRKFKATSKSEGTVDIETKVPARKAGYVRQYGITTAKGIAPTTFSELLISVEADIQVNNLQSGKIYAFREAIVISVKKKKTRVGTTPLTEKTASPTNVTKTNRPIFTDGAVHYVWSDWVYVVVM